MEINNQTRNKKIPNTEVNTDTNITHKYIKIAAINANSIIKQQRRYDLKKFVEDNSLDITLISETKLSQRHKLIIDGHKIIRTDRPGPNRGGGTAIVIKQQIEHTILTTPNSSSNKIIEYTLIKIKLNNNKSLIIGSLYATSKTDNKIVFTEEINSLFSKLNLSNTNNHYIIAGDFNARHTDLGDKTTKARGRWLINWENNNTVIYTTKIYAPWEPTFTTTQSVLDIGIIDSRLKLRNLINNKLSTLPYDSDRKAILIEIDLEDTAWTARQDNNINTCLYKKTNWKKFTKHLNDNYKIDIPNDRNLSTAEIDNYIEKIDDHIRDAIEKIVPTATSKSNNNYYVTNKTEKLHKEKSFLLTKLHQTQKNDPSNNRLVKHIKNLIEDMRNKIQSEIKKNMEQHWEKIHKKK